MTERTLASIVNLIGTRVRVIVGLVTCRWELTACIELIFDLDDATSPRMRRLLSSYTNCFGITGCPTRIP